MCSAVLVEGSWQLIGWGNGIRGNILCTCSLDKGGGGCGGGGSLAGAATSIIFVSLGKNMLVMTKCLSQLKIIFVTTNICHDKSFVMPKYFCATKLLSQQACFCCSKRRVLSRRK